VVDFAATQARAKEAPPFANREEGQTRAAVTKTLSALPPPTTDGVDMMYHELVEIHAITAAQLAECAHWHRSKSTSSPVWVRTGWQRPIMEPFAATLAPPSPTDSSPQAPVWR
jgi:hypothetical protein